MNVQNDVNDRILNLSALGLITPNEEITTIANTMIKLDEEDLCIALTEYEREFRSNYKK